MAGKFRTLTIIFPALSYSRPTSDFALTAPGVIRYINIEPMTVCSTPREPAVRRPAYLLVLACALLAAWPLHARQSTAHFRGTFIQLHPNIHGQWTPEQWERLFSYLRAYGVSEIVVQWSVIDGRAFYESDRFARVQQPPLKLILDLAARQHMKVLAGLAHDSDYWRAIVQDDASLQNYLKEANDRSVSAASELNALFSRHRAFAGWYIPAEVEDRHWLTGSRATLLQNALQDLARNLRRLTPKATIAVSGFPTNDSTPQRLGDLWHSLLASTPVDRVLFQDGIGVNKLDFQATERALQAVRTATRQQRREFRVVVETFSQVDGSPLNDKPFRAVPADAARILRQIEIAHRAARSSAIAFSIPQYMTPDDGAEAAALFQTLTGVRRSR